MLRKTCVTTIISFCLAFSMIIPAMAQEGSQQEITETELEKAAQAYTEIAMINNNFRQALQQTDNQEERQALQEKTQQKMINAVEKADLDVATYNNIMNTISNDEALANDFRTKIKSME